MWLTIHIADQVARRVVEHVVKVVMGTLGESKLGIVSGCGNQNSICCHPKGMEDRMARKILLSCFVDILGSQGFDRIATLEMKMVRLWLPVASVISLSSPPFPPPLPHFLLPLPYPQNICLHSSKLPFHILGTVHTKEVNVMLI